MWDLGRGNRSVRSYNICWYLRCRQPSPNSQPRIPSQWSPTVPLLRESIHRVITLFIIHDHNPMLSLFSKRVLVKWLRLKIFLLYNVPVNVPRLQAIPQRVWLTEAAPHLLFPGGKGSENAIFPLGYCSLRKGSSHNFIIWYLMIHNIKIVHL